MPAIPDQESEHKLLRTFSDKQLRTLIDSLSDFAVVMLTSEGFVTSWNAGAAHVTGYSISDALGGHFSHLFAYSQEKPKAYAELLRDADQTGKAELESWLARKGGSRYWGSMVIHPIAAPDGGAVGYACIVRDITERHLAQKELLESERRFRLLVEGVTDYALYMLDPSGMVVNWNPGAERLKGYTAEEIVGQHLSKFYTAQDRASGLPVRVLTTAAQTGRYEGEGWRVRKDGSQFWASVVVDAIHDPVGKLIGFAKITRDISERRSAQDALRRSERQLRLLIDGVKDYALFMLDPNGVVASWNEGARRIKGYEAHEIIGSHFSRFYVEDDRAAGLPARALLAAEAEGRFEMEGWRLRKDGSMFWANVVIAGIKDSDGRTLGFAKITRDITEKRNVQLALVEAERRASQSQKMEALGHLTGGVAHDFNNLMMIISGQAQVMKRATGDDPRAAKAAEAIESAIRRGASLTRQLLTFSRRQTLSPRRIDLAKQIDAFKTMVMDTMGGLSIHTMVPPGTWPIVADPNELEISLLNLAINARDAMSAGGTLTITAENAILPPGEPGELEGEVVAIRVSDTGAGIAPDILSKVFDPFFTTKQEHKGSGLGLSQVHGFVHQSGGKVTIESELGKGTRITLYLPKAMGGEDAVDVPAAAPITGRGTVLVVDDNPDVSDAAGAMLKELGYQVVTAADAAQARALLATEKPLLVLCDIVMPGATDGLALARELRAAHPGLPLVLMTGYSRNMPADGEFPVVRKPSTLAELGRVVRSAVAAKEALPDNLIPLRRPSE